MISKHIAASILMASVAIMPASQVSAGSGDVVGGIIGGIIGGAIANQSNKRRATTRRVKQKSTRRSSGVSSAVRAENRQIQTSLNYFGFPAGTPDGSLGRRSRAAISSYQAFMGYGVTGQLTTYEKDFLLSSFHRAQSGGYATQELINENGQGTQGLLVSYREERSGGSGQNFAGGGALGGLPKEVAKSVREIAKSSDPTASQLIQRAGFVQLSDMNADGRTDYILDTSVTGSAFWCNAQSCAVRVFLSTPSGYARNDFQAFNVTPAMFTCHGASCQKTDGPTTQMATAPARPQAQQLAPTIQAGGGSQPVPTAQPSVRTVATAPAAPAAPALPNFMGAGTNSGQPSLASHCNQVSLLTNSNGGFVTQATMSDPEFALNEQFCLARTYAITKGEDMARSLNGVSMPQLESQCAAFGPMLKSHITGLSLKPHDQIMQDVSSFVLTTGMSPAQLVGTAKICLSVGYRTDNLDVALGSALLLTVLGQQPYGELLGHHLTQGYGVGTRPDLALAWYKVGIDAIARGQAAVFAPGNPQRTNLIQKAAFQLNGIGDQSSAAPAETQVQPVATLPTFMLNGDSNN